MKKLAYLVIIALFIQTEGIFSAYAQIDKKAAFMGQLDTRDDHSASNLTTPPIPAPPAVSLPELPPLEMDSPVSINWRCRALSLANEYPLKKNSIAWALPVSYVKAQSLLRQAITQTGMILVAEYDDAGQFLVSLPESNRKNDIILLIQPVTDRSTLFKMHFYGDYRSTEVDRLNCLPGTIKNLLENHGLWQ